MYQVIGQYFEKRFSDKQICDIELLTRTGTTKNGNGYSVFGICEENYGYKNRLFKSK